MTNPYKRRLGAIKYTAELLDKNPEAITLLYTYFIPLDLKYNTADDVYDVKGLSLSFREVAIGDVIPSYRVTFKQKSDAGQWDIFFTEVI